MQNQIDSKTGPQGYLALVLHAHLPYIRHYDRDDYMEERWFHEAMTETYLPLIDIFDRLLNDGVDFRMTLSFSPTLLSLFSDPLMQNRYLKHLERLIELADKEKSRLRGDRRFLPLAEMYAGRLRILKVLYTSCDRNIVTKFKYFQDIGKIEIITSAASHGFLPLMKTEEAIYAQLATAVREYERYFARKPRGVWLPECGFTNGIDRILKSLGIDYFFADAAAIEYATPRPNRELYAPLMTPYGVSVFARDPESSEQVWSKDFGYPGDYDYREYYRDIGWDLGWNDPEEWEYIRPYVLPTHERINTGIKYYRITGPGAHREPYNPEWARNKASMHAGNFIFNRQKQAEAWHSRLDRPPIIVSPYDAELFGHWWYEGPMWIEILSRKIHHHQNQIRMITPSEYLERYPLSDTGFVNESSWGRNHSAEVWLQGNNDWIYRHLHQAEERMIQLATKHQHLLSTHSMPASLLKRALNQAVRELMLAQSSDWAFIMDTGSVVDYAVRRTKDHLGCFNQLCNMIDQEHIDERFLRELEAKDNCLTEVDYLDYRVLVAVSPIAIVPDIQRWKQLLEETGERPNTFMLAWEYPPKYVGGLSRAVSELAEALAAQGEIVHVVTTSHWGSPDFERLNGVYVHRLPLLTSGDTDFYHWTFEMNLAMVDHLVQWKEHGGRIDLLHAHDWMVYHAAREIKHSYGIPLVATIHATEWGRNQGNLHTDLQHKIHGIEWKLTYEARRVFVCSDYMKRELTNIFRLPEDKITIIPNGIALKQPLSATSSRPGRLPWFRAEEKVIFFIGRLVFEKGVQVLLESMPRVLAQVPNAKLVIAGEGPMKNELMHKAEHLGDRVAFVGYVDNALKESLYASADLCVIPSLYEPFGIVALEAMKHRIPVVVSDVGGLAEIINHGKDGYKALPGHVESLSWHISELLLQPELGSLMAEAAYQKLQNEYNWEIIASRMKDIFHDLYFFTPEPLLIRS
ncbi:1,4-alpha-glucan branching protein domain-containing protein [Ferviditalea candida]|uniref:1,4-alpha-glucan branching protein domain-containing protein n=1 Tax=Ferviditalea candida TaxID=3108399 RepID=A0ABU5ZIC6_9BACL|nr:1,4-alpha-glucan branching protein domain-containing protein [Paenibacillaceae bacterium T2]